MNLAKTTKLNRIPRGRLLPLVLALLAGSIVPILRSQEVTIFGRDLRLDGQSGWIFYDENDARAYWGGLPAGVSSLKALIDLGSVLTPGTYQVFIKSVDYDRNGWVAINLGGGTASIPNKDRDVNGYWTEPAVVTVTAATNIIAVTFNKTQPIGSEEKCLFYGLYVTTNLNEIVDRNDFLVDFHYPSSADYDNNPPVKGNLVPNSSFEVGIGHGWGIYSSPGRDELLADCWSTNTSYHGRGSLRLLLPQNRYVTVISKPFSVKPNKKHTLSVYVKSSARNWATLRVYNGYIPPAAPGYESQQMISTGILANTTWQRISLSGHLLKYPVSDFHVRIEAQELDGGEVWFDAVQLEEGDLSPYAPMSAMDVGCSSTNLGNVFYEDEPAQMLLHVCNHSAASVSTNVDFEIRNSRNELLSSGTRQVTSLGAGETYHAPLVLDRTRRGIFRLQAWVRGMHNTEEEVLYAVIPRPGTMAADNDSIMGGHIDYYPWQLKLMQKLGIKWTRGLSTGQCWRWLNAEPTEGNFVWFDELVNRPAKYGITIMANIGGVAPPWAYRTYFGLANVAGAGFRPGEPVTSPGGGSGNVSLVLTSTNATGHALQLTNVQGNFITGSTVTGLSSGSSGAIRTPVYPESVALDKWENFVATVVSHYRTNVFWWEIWNEPDQDPIKLPQPDGDPAFYAEILQRAAAKIRSVAPNAKIVGMGGVLHHQFIKKVMDYLGPSATNYMDAIGVHLYPPNGVVAADLKRNTIDVYKKPVWNTETGAWDLGFYTGVNANFRRQGKPLMPFRDADRFYMGHVTEAEKVAVNFIQSIGNGLSKYFYYDSRQAARPDYYKIHPTMIDYDDTVRTKGIVYAILGSFFDHSVGQGKVNLVDPGVEAYLFDKQGVPLVGLVTTSQNNKLVNLSASLSVGNIKMFDMMGNEQTISGMSIPCGRAPVYLVGGNITLDRMRNALVNATVTAPPDERPPQLSITLGPRGPVPRGEEIHLRWLGIDDRFIPSEVDPNAILYSWKLEPKDSEWSAWGGDTRVDYHGLAPGVYVFKVKAKDKAGNTSPEQSREVIVLNPDGSWPVVTQQKPTRPSNLRIGT